MEWAVAWRVGVLLDKVRTLGSVDLLEGNGWCLGLGWQEGRACV